MSKVQDQENIIPNNKSGQYCIDYDCTLSTFTYNEYDIIAVTAGITQIHGTFLKHLLMLTLFLFSTEGEQNRKTTKNQNFDCTLKSKHCLTFLECYVTKI